jgi:hypothetical protein
LVARRPRRQDLDEPDVVQRFFGVGSVLAFACGNHEAAVPAKRRAISPYYYRRHARFAVARKKRVASLETGLATLGPAPGPSTTVAPRGGDEADFRSPAVVTYRRVLAEKRTPIILAFQPTALLAVSTRADVVLASHNAAIHSVDAHFDKGLPADLAEVLEFARSPVLANSLRDSPLPHGIVRLMRIAGGSIDALQHAVRLTGKDPAYLRAAIIFYLEKALWTEQRDSYRVLGATADTPQDELAERVRWLMAWLHPHIGGTEPEAFFADCVVRAWLAVKTPAVPKIESQASLQPETPLAPLSRSRSARFASKTRNVERPGRRLRVRWSIAAAALVGLGAIVAIAGSGTAKPFLHAKSGGGLFQGAPTTSTAQTEPPADGS